MSDLVISILLDGLFAGIAAVGFAVISNPPRRTILFSALLAAIGHAFRFYLMHIGIALTLSTFLAAFIIGLLSIVFAKMLHTPAEIFSFPSLLPMIPGIYAYETVLGLVKFMTITDRSLSGQLMVDVFHDGLTTVFVMFAIVVGVSLPMFTFYEEFFSTTRLSKPFMRFLWLQKRKHRPNS